MRWGAFALALLVTLLLQNAVLWPLGASWVDLFLVLALLLGLAARTHDACIAGWLTGIVQDLSSAGMLGIHAFALGIAALLLTRLRERVNLSVWWVRLLVTFAAALAAQLIYHVHLVFWEMHPGAVSWWAIVGLSVRSAAIASWLAVSITMLPWLILYNRRRRRTYRLARGVAR